MYGIMPDDRTLFGCVVVLVCSLVGIALGLLIAWLL